MREKYLAKTATVLMIAAGVGMAGWGVSGMITENASSSRILNTATPVYATAEPTSTALTLELTPFLPTQEPQVLTPTRIPTASALPLPSPTSTPKMVEKLRQITIPTIELESPVIEAKIVNDSWEVPKHVVGHLEGTAGPGEIGNIGLVGHMTSISSGEIFADIDELKPGDQILLETEKRQYTYKIREVVVVSRDDLTLLKPTSTATVTLITCTGNWVQLLKDYDRRLLVIADLVQTPN